MRTSKNFNLFTHFIIPVSTLILILSSSDSWSQNQSKKKKPKATPAASQSAPAVVTTTAPETAPAMAKESSEKPQPVEFNAQDIWSQEIFSREDHKVIVLQDRRYNKAGGFEFGIHGGTTVASAFYNTLSYGVHADYYFSEYWGLEAIYNFSTSTPTADQRDIQNFLEAFSFPATKEYHQPKHFAALGLVWAPIYGKFAFFRSNIIHFDFFGTLGAGYLTTLSNKKDVSTINGQVPGQDQELITSLLGVGVRVFLSQNWSLRLDVKNALYGLYFAPNGENKTEADGVRLLRQNWQFTLGTSFIFGANE